MTEKDIREAVARWLLFVVHDIYDTDREKTAVTLGIGVGELMRVTKDIISKGASAQ